MSRRTGGSPPGVTQTTLRSHDTAEVLSRLPDDVGFSFDDGAGTAGWTVPPAGWSAFEDR